MSDLLKQAIADAKAVRATALANAKAALEEAFTPKIQSMLAEKLKQEVEGSEEPLPAAPAPEVAPAPVHADAAQDAAMMAAQAPAAAPTEEIPMEEEEMDEVRGTLSVTSAPDAAVDSEIQAGTFVNEADKVSSDYTKTTTGHKTEDPGKNMVKSAAAAIGGTKGSLPATKKADKASADYTKTTAGHKTEDPQGASNDIVALEEGEEIDEASLEEVLKELEASVNEVDMDEMAAPAMEAAPVAEETDEEINLDELLSEGKDKEEKEEEKDEVDEGKLPPGLAKYKKEKAEKEEKHDDESIVNENISLKKEIEEYRSAVTYLRDRINEVNLLNAKLLYTNKLFKGTNLSNEQKLKVIESFDLTKSVREAKLVYATLAESFSFGAKKEVVPAKKQVSTTVKTITEGLASKPVASTKPSKPAVIAEGAEMANRFKKLAGIR